MFKFNFFRFELLQLNIFTFGGRANRISGIRTTSTCTINATGTFYGNTNSAANVTTAALSIIGGSPTVTVTGGYRIYTWTGSGSITF